MHRASTVSAIFFLLVCAGNPAAGQETAGCALTRFADVDISVTKDNITFPMIIDEMPAIAVLDLKNAFNMTTRANSDKFDLTVRSLDTRLRPATPEGEITSYARQISVKIGLVRLALDALLYPTDDELEGADIALGMSAFSNVDLELDFANSKLFLYSQDHCEGEVVYWADRYGRVPLRDGQFGQFLVMELDGKKIQTSIATDTNATALDGAALSRIYGIGADVLGEGQDHFLFMSLTAEGVEVMGANIAIEKDDGYDCGLQTSLGEDDAAGYTSCGNLYPLKLGLDVLQQMHVYFAMGEQMMYFTAADARRSSAQ